MARIAMEREEEDWYNNDNNNTFEAAKMAMGEVG